MTKRVSTYGNGRAALQAALSKRESFTTSGALRGEVWERDMIEWWELGQLSAPDMQQFFMDHMTGISYVVWSYDTPIAWVRKDTGEAVIPSTRYSRTTSKHQGIVATYL